MKLLKFNSIKLSCVITIIYGIIQVLLMSSLSLLITNSIETLFKTVVFLIILYFTQSLLLYLSEKTKYISSYYLKLQLNIWLDNNISTKEYENFISKETGEYASLYVNDIPTINSMLLHRFIAIILDITLTISILISLFNIHWSMFIMGITVIICMSLLPKTYKRKLDNALSTSQKSKEKFLYRMNEILQSFPLFFECQKFNYYYKSSSAACSEYSYRIYQTDKIGASLSAILNFFSSFLSLLSLTLLSVLVIKEKVSLGYFLSTLSLMPTLSSAVASLMTDITFYNSGNSLFNEKFKDIKKEYNNVFCKPFLIKKINDYYNTNTTSHHSITINNIETKNLIVHFDNKDICIQDCYFEKGKKYALTGISGCGKSTLLKTIIGEITHYDGQILINGQEKMKNDNLLDSIGYVNQNIILLNATFYENITLDEDISKEKVSDIMNLVGLTQFNLEDMIEEHGKNLSGGQKQRIALARVLLTNKDIIFIDEATANLDPISAKLIESMLLSLDKTIVMITHHLKDEIINKYDKIIELKA